MNATLLASGGALLSGLTPHQLMAQMGKDNWTGYGGVGDYAESHGNTFEVMTAGHQIRDHIFTDPPHQAEETGEVFDFAIVGGGLSGLATACTFSNMRRGQPAWCWKTIPSSAARQSETNSSWTASA